MESAKELLFKIQDVILNPIIALLFALALLYFLWGVFEMIRDSDSPDGRKQGGQHILWGIIGMVIMVSVWGIISIIENTLGVDRATVEPSTQSVENEGF